MVGYSGSKSVVQKLGLKPGFCIFVDGLPVAYADVVGALPLDVRIAKTAKGPLDVVHLFAAVAKGLAAKLSRYRQAIAPDGTIWVSWPKKSSGVATDLTETAVRETALAAGLVDIKVCAVDEVWSGLKFVIPLKERGKAPK
ncbi:MULTISPECIES: DUF3052 family protein [unclassified Bradyrhizobium]|uniref:DUF3052 family protein n=1 Tax=unclassified Bradyrhizobium TaxID=2631580 RepID=UPI002478CA3C|nr:MULTISPECIES: DUF3052 family protein [unclassified Bradyrhizobium]WGS20239.1 DUF3052 domain-containing protein [Bradyrhizobium sp. ISRA463]WGS27108.1 DUF3052 domain-containing protein [Bradyrhizobium sp. ISRA464]